jgi:hypothetical protein
MTDRCESLFLRDQVGESGTAWYYRCQRPAGHHPPHRGGHVDLWGVDVGDSAVQTWPESASLNPPQLVELHEHRNDPNQMTFDLETLT